MRFVKTTSLIILSVLLVAACQSQAPAPEPTYTVYPTYTLYPTYTPAPRPTAQAALPSDEIENLVWPTGPRDDVIPFEDAADFMGEKITVEGTVIRTHNSDNVVFLNFSNDNQFVAVIFPDDWAKFPDPPEDLFYGKLVRIEGMIEDYQGTPEIIINDPWQIEVALTLGQPVISDCDCSQQLAQQPELSQPPEPTQEIESTSAADAFIAPTTEPETTVSPTEESAEPDAVETTEAPALAETQLISWQDAGGYEGQTITVAGKIVDTYNSGNVVFLNFDQDYRNTFKVAIFPDTWSLFPSPPEEYYNGKTVQVTGQVKMYQNAPEIIVDHPDQIEFVE